jgi:hypothetical protein
MRRQSVVRGTLSIKAFVVLDASTKKSGEELCPRWGKSIGLTHVRMMPMGVQFVKRYDLGC